MQADLIVMRGVFETLAAVPEFDVVECFLPPGVRANGALRAVRDIDIVVVALRSSDDVLGVAELHHVARGAPVVALCQPGLSPQDRALVADDFVGCLEWYASPDSLVAAMWTLINGQSFERPVPGRSFVPLTLRERDVLSLIAAGETHKRVASRLGLAKSTVDTYVLRLRRKLGLRNKAELVRAAIRLGLGEG